VSLDKPRTPQRPADDEASDVALACEGDRDAFERLYRLHVARIYGLARRMGGLERVDDLTQNVFVHAWVKLRTFRGESRFGTWLYRLAVNIIVEELRRPGNRTLWQDADEDVMRNLSVAPADNESSLDLAAAVERLPEGARRVFLLHDVEGYVHREIGKLVGITPGTSKGQLHRARMILRRYLGATWTEPS
jgi:RNA polymerase sigma-70 factor (ECF subfamily)